MRQQQLFKVRDKRNKNWLWVDNDYLNGYARVFGAVGTAIYVSLCRHADNETQECFPSQEKIAEELNISSRTVRKYLKLFEKHHLISIRKEKDPITKKCLNNVYTLLDKSEWDKPEEIISDGKPEENNDKSQRKITTGAIGNQRPNNNTHINNTHINNTNNNKNNSEFKNSPLKRKDFKVKPEIYKELTDAYQQYKGIKLSGAEFGEVRRAIKTMLYSGRTKENIIDFMKFCAETVEKMKEDPELEKKFCWLENWTILTIKRKLPEFLAGKFQKVDTSWENIPEVAKRWIK